MESKVEKLVVEKKPEEMPLLEQVRQEAKEWVNEIGTRLSSTDLEIKLTLLRHKAKERKIPKEEIKIWDDVIREEMAFRKGDLTLRIFYQDLDFSLYERNVLEATYGNWEKVPEPCRNKWQKEKDKLIESIESRREQLLAKEKKTEK